MNERSRPHPARSDVRVGREACPFCREAVGPGEDKTACDGCMAWHHAECWREHGACSACGGQRALQAGLAGGGCAWPGCGEARSGIDLRRQAAIPGRDGGRKEFRRLEDLCRGHAAECLSRLGRQQLFAIGVSALVTAVMCVFLASQTSRSSSDFSLAVGAAVLLCLIYGVLVVVQRRSNSKALADLRAAGPDRAKGAPGPGQGK